MSLCRVADLARGGGEDLRQTLAIRGVATDSETALVVSQILGEIEREGEVAALRYARKFDAPDLESLPVSEKELFEAEVPEAHLGAIRHSIERVRRFHEDQLHALTFGWDKEHLADDRACWSWSTPAREGEQDTGTEGQRLLALDSVGVYVPGGQANYASSVIMNVVPAQVAGVEDITMCCPARSDGTLSPAVLVAARELGLRKVLKAGGAAGVGLLALGPKGEFLAGGEHVLPVDALVGPGNKWVNEAKRQLWGRVGLDGFAGPSEVCVIADGSAEPAFAAADWLTQVEHADDNEGYLIVDSPAMADRILAEAERQLSGAPREATMRKALSERGWLIIVSRVAEAYELANTIAPEHLTLMVRDPDEAMRAVRHAGCILIGDYTPQSAGDFVSGPSHTLPTATAARFGSPVNVMSFLKLQSVSRLSQADLKSLVPTIEAFGEMEGFPQHARGGSVRFEAK